MSENIIEERLSNILPVIEQIASNCVKITNNTKADLFFSYSGHVNLLSIYGYIDGRQDDRPHDINTNLYLDLLSIDETLIKLLNINSNLEKMLNGDKFELSDLSKNVLHLKYDQYDLSKNEENE